MKKLNPVTPGELLREEFLIPMAISQYRLAKEIGVPAQRISEIVAGKRTVTADTDLRLCRFFGLSKGYWLRAQAAHDTEVAEDALAEDLDRIKPWSGTAA
ncbi:MAG TPA: HigA family addiction module antitoxin [Thermoanaerobaculia bacterium]|nr:HigA family addiction module antitoxin [Thermoanaerobaculia bacterium]